MPTIQATKITSIKNRMSLQELNFPGAAAAEKRIKTLAAESVVIPDEDGSDFS